MQISLSEAEAGNRNRREGDDNYCPDATAGRGSKDEPRPFAAENDRFANRRIGQSIWRKYTVRTGR